MLKSVNAIFLISVYFLLLIHEMIPHHHHAEHLAQDISNSFTETSIKHDHLSSGHSHDDHHHHHDNDGHHHHTTNKKNDANIPASHDHDFPWHSHSFTADESDYFRTSFTNYDLKPVSTDCIETTILSALLKDTQKGYILKITDPPFIIRDLFEPGAIALRAPPAIA